jgi:hypothetical protein
LSQKKKNTSGGGRRRRIAAAAAASIDCTQHSVAIPAITNDDKQAD